MDNVRSAGCNRQYMIFPCLQNVQSQVGRSRKQRSVQAGVYSVPNGTVSADHDAAAQPYLAMQEICQQEWA